MLYINFRIQLLFHLILRKAQHVLLLDLFNIGNDNYCRGNFFERTNFFVPTFYPCYAFSSQISWKERIMLLTKTWMTWPRKKLSQIKCSINLRKEYNLNQNKFLDTSIKVLIVACQRGGVSNKPTLVATRHGVRDPLTILAITTYTKF